MVPILPAEAAGLEDTERVEILELVESYMDSRETAVMTGDTESLRTVAVNGIVNDENAHRITLSENNVSVSDMSFQISGIDIEDTITFVTLYESMEYVDDGVVKTADIEHNLTIMYDETVVLLSHKKADSYIHIDVEFGEGEGKIPVDSIAKRAEAYKPKEKVTYKMIKEYIEAKYGFKVHTAYIAEVKRDLGLPMYDAPNAVEELKQPRKHPTPEKVEAIKDALRYFAVI